METLDVIKVYSNLTTMFGQGLASIFAVFQ